MHCLPQNCTQVARSQSQSQSQSVSQLQCLPFTVQQRYVGGSVVHFFSGSGWFSGFICLVVLYQLQLWRFDELCAGKRFFLFASL